MGNYLTKGTTFADGGPCNALLLNAHVDDAILKATAISSQALKSPGALTDEFLINDGGSLKKVTLQQIHDLVLYAGSILQLQRGTYTANTSLSTQIPIDDTIPQNTEGTEILSVSITPRFATSLIMARFTGFGTNSTGGRISCALFRDSVASALAAATQTITGSGDDSHNFILEFIDSPATISAVTYKIRVGPNTGNMRMNGNTSGRYFGSVASSLLVLMEIKV